MTRRVLYLTVLFISFVLPHSAEAQGGGPPDFRPFVFGAYTVAFLFLFAFVAILHRRQTALEREIAALKARVQKPPTPK